MSMIRHILCALIVISVLTFPRYSQAETPDTTEGHPNPAVVKTAELVMKTIDVNELRCLARNIYFEAGSEPEEGKVAVGLVTLNRRGDSRFSSTICGVINQRISAHPHGRANCQFSWRCVSVRLPNDGQSNWIECQRIATALLSNDEEYRYLVRKYRHALYFHTIHVRPVWVRHKERIGRAGSQWFYADSRST